MPPSKHGVHGTAQTAFRLPEGLLAWLKEQAGREGGGVTMTAIVERALEAERERCGGITTSAASPAAVSPPAPAIPFLAAEDEQSQPAARNCKHRGFRGVKGVCPDCYQPVGYK